MNSMTGFGRATGVAGAQGFSVQVSAVNRRALEVKVVRPEAWEALEGPVVEAVKRVALRGTVQVRIELEGGSPGAGLASEFDEAAAGQWLDRLAAFAARREMIFSPTTDALVHAALQFRRRAEPPPVEVAREAVLAALEEALGGFAAMRATEGAALRADLEARLASLLGLAEGIAARAPQVVAAAREALLRRLREAGLELRVDDERVLKEIALFADRCDISEELTRFRSHHAQLARLFAGGGEIGRKAEFILQELGREVNTTGAKANDYEIASRVIELKNELERIKEQVANVE
jgi:uncharacterized protein (TIGR00255 family)